MTELERIDGENFNEDMESDLGTDDEQRNRKENEEGCFIRIVKPSTEINHHEIKDVLKPRLAAMGDFKLHVGEDEDFDVSRITLRSISGRHRLVCGT